VSNKTVARLVPINLGRPKILPHQGKNAQSSVFKTPVEGTLRIDGIELEGDAQVDLSADRDCWRKYLAHWKPPGIAKGEFVRNAKDRAENRVPDLRGDGAMR
jgi:hypothetical protein